MSFNTVFPESFILDISLLKKIPIYNQENLNSSSACAFCTVYQYTSLLGELSLGELSLVKCCEIEKISYDIE